MAKTIGVIGTQTRIGTTTQALQITAYLIEMGYEAAYIEMADQGYLGQMKLLYRNIEEQDHALVCNELPLYSASDLLSANKKGFDYLIKDYGVIGGADQAPIHFLEQSIKVVVGGVKPNEMEAVEYVLSCSWNKEVKLLFNFVPPEEQQDIRAMMMEHQTRTYFTAYAPNPFVLQPSMEDVYSYLLGDES